MGARKAAFKQSQKVVYPLQGVGEIQEITFLLFKGEDTPYYIIHFPVSDMTIKVPIDKAQSLGIRAIVSRKKAEDALKLFSEDFESPTTDWKQRYQTNLELLKVGSIESIATVVRNLYTRKKVKDLPIMERKLYDSALQLFLDEISYALNVTIQEVEKQIFNAMDKQAQLKIHNSISE